MALPADTNGLCFDPDDGWRESQAVNGTCWCTCTACGRLAEVYDEDEYDHYYDEDDSLEECNGHWNPVCSAHCAEQLQLEAALDDRWKVPDGL